MAPTPHPHVDESDSGTSAASSGAASSGKSERVSASEGGRHVMQDLAAQDIEDEEGGDTQESGAHDVTAPHTTNHHSMQDVDAEEIQGGDAAVMGEGAGGMEMVQEEEEEEEEEEEGSMSLKHEPASGEASGRSRCVSEVGEAEEGDVLVHVARCVQQTVARCVESLVACLEREDAADAMDQVNRV